MREREAVKAAIEQVLRKEFPTDTVDVSDGHGTNIHLVVVSRRFDPMSIRESHEFVWDLLDNSGALSEAEMALISLVVASSPSLLT
ncbi:MAG: hypothetical protein R3F39_14170 [Myxococcota bacterium]